MSATITGRAMFVALSEAWKGCRQCSLRDKATQVVLPEWRGSGRPLLVLGEAPGAREDLEGRPFTGASGQVLRDEMLRPAGADAVCIANTVACRPPDNRVPTGEEIATCSGWVDLLVEAIAPVAVLYVGNVARDNAPHARWARTGTTLPSLAVVHPSALLRQGFPNRTTRDRVDRAAVKIRALLVKAGVVEDLSRCSHDPVTVGCWAERVPMFVCRRCTRILSPPARRKVA